MSKQSESLLKVIGKVVKEVEEYFPTLIDKIYPYMIQDKYKYWFDCIQLEEDFYVVGQYDEYYEGFYAPEINIPLKVFLCPEAEKEFIQGYKANYQKHMDKKSEAALLESKATEEKELKQLKYLQDKYGK